MEPNQDEKTGKFGDGRGDARVAVEDDLRASLAAHFPLDEKRGILSDRPGLGDLQPPPLRDGYRVQGETSEAVPWRYHGIDTVGVHGLAPTGRPVVIRGVTVVDRGADDGKVRYLRYVDWLDVYSQLGLTMIARAGIEPPPAPPPQPRATMADEPA